jgi:hypothetical protein
LSRYANIAPLTSTAVALRRPERGSVTTAAKLTCDRAARARVSLREEVCQQLGQWNSGEQRGQNYNGFRSDLVGRCGEPIFGEKTLEEVY